MNPLRIRPSPDEYFLKIAQVVAERSTCLRHQVGALAVKDKRILTTGYNGAPSNTKDCLELGCIRDEKKIASGERHEICRAIHAEQNVIIQAALHGVDLEGCTIYCTYSPCILCAKMLVNAKISRHVYSLDYPDPSFRDLYSEVGITFQEIKPYRSEFMETTLVVAGCIVSNDRKVLLGLREKSGSLETLGMWEMLGGCVEEGETPEEALARELLEEAGILVEVIELLHAKVNTYSDNVPYLVLYYYCRVLDFKGQGEGVITKWVSPKSKEFENSLPGTDEALGRLISRGLF